MRMSKKSKDRVGEISKEIDTKMRQYNMSDTPEYLKQDLAKEVDALLKEQDKILGI